MYHEIGYEFVATIPDCSLTLFVCSQDASGIHSLPVWWKLRKWPQGCSAARLKVGLKMILQVTVLARGLVTRMCKKSYYVSTASKFTSGSQEIIKNFEPHCLRILSGIIKKKKNSNCIWESNYLKCPEEEKVRCLSHISLLTVASDVTGCVPS